MSDPITSLARWSEYFESQVREYLSEAGHGALSPAMERMLERLRDAPDATGSQLAAAAGVSAQAVSKVISALFAGGYVANSPHPIDRRCRVLSLTDLGRAALATATEAREQLWNAAATDVRALVAP